MRFMKIRLKFFVLHFPNESLYEHLFVMINPRVSPDDENPPARGHRRREIEGRNGKAHDISEEGQTCISCAENGRPTGGSAE